MGDPMRLDEEGVLVLGIVTNQNNYVGAPHGNTVVSAGDSVILYGPRSTLQNLDDRAEARQKQVLQDGFPD